MLLSRPCTDVTWSGGEGLTGGPEGGAGAKLVLELDLALLLKKRSDNLTSETNLSYLIMKKSQKPWQDFLKDEIPYFLKFLFNSKGSGKTVFCILFVSASALPSFSKSGYDFARHVVSM